ncbi:MAG: SAM-dependent chlorinase/fluorinase [bacterium]|nr:SAM-dependent chlorinase/fluorinase [bacterium]
MLSRRRHNFLPGLICLALLLAGCAGLWPGHTRPLSAHVVNISDEYANINTDLSEQRLAAAGITHGSTFQARLRQQRIEVMLGKGYKDVERGEWVGLIEEDGALQIAISFGHAATVLECAVGDTLFITPIRRP